MSRKTYKAAPEQIQVRPVPPGPDAFELVIASAQNQPLGNNPPTMRYMLFRRHMVELVELLQKALSEADPTPPSGNHQRH